MSDWRTLMNSPTIEAVGILSMLGSSRTHKRKCDSQPVHAQSDYSRHCNDYLENLAIQSMNNNQVHTYCDSSGQKLVACYTSNSLVDVRKDIFHNVSIAKAFNKISPHRSAYQNSVCGIGEPRQSWESLWLLYDELHMPNPSDLF